MIAEDRRIELAKAGVSRFRAQHGDLRLGTDPDSPRARSLDPIARYYRAGKITVRQRDAADKLHALWSRSGYDGWRGCVPEPGAFVDTSKAGRANRHPGGGPGAAEYMAAMKGLPQLQGLTVRQVVLYGADLKELAGAALDVRAFMRLLRAGLDTVAERLGI